MILHSGQSKLKSTCSINVYNYVSVIHFTLKLGSANGIVSSSDIVFLIFPGFESHIKKNNEILLIFKVPAIAYKAIANAQLIELSI